MEKVKVISSVKPLFEPLLRNFVVLSQEIWIGMLSNTLEPPCGFELEKKVTNDVP